MFLYVVEEKRLCWRKFRFFSNIQSEILPILKFQRWWWWSKGHDFWFLFHKSASLWSRSRKRKIFWKWFVPFNELSTISWFNFWQEILVIKENWHCFKVILRLFHCFSYSCDWKIESSWTGVHNAVSANSPQEPQLHRLNWQCLCALVLILIKWRKQTQSSGQKSVAAKSSWNYAQGTVDLIVHYAFFVILTLCFIGIADGLVISRKQEDEYRLACDRVIGNFEPFVSANHYR